LTDFYSSAIITATNELDVKFNTPYGESWSQFLSGVYVTYAQEIQALAEIMGKGIRDTQSNAYIPYCTNLLATAILTGSLDYGASATITEHSELDVRYNIPYGENFSSIVNEAIIKNRKHLGGRANIELLKSDLINEVLIPYMEGIHSTASVNENLSLDVVLGILQPPQIIMTIDALQDTYTRQARPYNNYGYLQTLAAGKAVEGEFRTYIDFDLTEIAKIIDQAIISIDFKIVKSGTPNGHINVSECYTNWNEGFLMWVNVIEHSAEPIFSFSSGTLADITSIVVDHIKAGKTKLSLMLTSDDFITFQSKESGNPPQLVVTYADPGWLGFIGEANEYCSAVIKNDSRKVFHSIFSILHQSMSQSVAVLREKGLKEAEGTIVNPVLGGRADISANSSALTSLAMIKNTSDLASSFDKNASENSSTVDILMRNRFASFADIAPGQAYDWREHSVLIKATASFADSFAILLEKIMTHGSAQIKPYNEVGGSANLISPYTHNEVTITTFRNLASEVTIGNLEGTDIFAEASIKHRTDLPSTGIITGEIFADNIAEAIIRPSDALNIYSNVFIKELSLLDSFGQITNHDLNHIPSSAIVREYYQYHHYNTALIEEFVHFGGEAGILRVDGSNEYSTAYIMLPETMDHNAEAYLHEIRVFENEAMLNELRHLVSDAIVRRNGEVDLQALSDILRISDNTSVADLRRIAQIIGTAIIREEGIRLYENEAYLNGWHPFDTGFFANIFATGSFKHSYATIRSDARMWTPPAAIGKLPRTWRWENFFYST